MNPLELLAMAEAAFNLYLRVMEHVNLTPEDKETWEKEQREIFLSRDPEGLSTK